MRSIWPLLIANTFCLAALMAIIPVIGPIIRELGLAEFHGGLVISIAGFLWMLSAKHWGNASDIYGRKRIILLGLAGFLITYLAMCFYLEYALIYGGAVWLIVLFLTVTRGFIGAFYSAVPTSVAAKIIDVSPVQKRGANLSKFGAANAVGLVLGPSLAGFLSAFGLVKPLWAAWFLVVLVLPLVIWKIPSDRPVNVTQKPSMKISDTRIRLPVIASSIVFYAIITFQACIGFYAIDVLGQDTSHAAQSAGYAMTLVGVSLIVVQTIATRFEKVHSTSWITAGTFIGICGLITFILVPNKFGFYLGSIMLPSGFGLVVPAFQTLAANSVSDSEQGQAAGSVSAAQALAATVAPLLSTALYQLSYITPYLIAISLLTVLLLLSFRAWQKREAII